MLNADNLDQTIVITSQRKQSNQVNGLPYTLWSAQLPSLLVLLLYAV